MKNRSEGAVRTEDDQLGIERHAGFDTDAEPFHRAFHRIFGLLCFRRYSSIFERQRRLLPEPARRVD